MGLPITAADRGELLAHIDRISGYAHTVQEHLQVVAARQGREVSPWALKRLGRILDDAEALYDAVNVAPMDPA